MITTQINIKPHLAEFAFSLFRFLDTDAVAFPPPHYLYTAICSMMEARPSHCKPTKGNLTIRLPHASRGKNPMHCNFITRENQKEMEAKIETLFWSYAYEFIDSEVNNFKNTIKEAIYMFMDIYNVKSISHNAIKKSHYRWRKKTGRIYYKREYSYKKAKKEEKRVVIT